jgi:hypothetical protein
MQQPSKLTAQQGQKLNEFLTKYDSSNLSENDARGLAELAGVQEPEGVKPSGPQPSVGQDGPGAARRPTQTVAVPNRFGRCWSQPCKGPAMTQRNQSLISMPKALRPLRAMRPSH